MTRPATLTAYLNDLDASGQRAFAALSRAVEDAVGNRTGEVADLIFLAGAKDHPRYADHAEVFWLSAGQLLFDAGPLPGELPLAFLGYHGKMRLVRKRFAQGFLLTDARILSRDDFEPFGEQPPVRTDWFADDDGPAARETAERAWRAFDSSSLASLAGAEALVQLRNVLLDVAGSAAVASRVIGHTPPMRAATGRTADPATQDDSPRAGSAIGDASAAIPPAADLPGRVQELGLTGIVRLAGDKKAAKHLAKLAKAVQAPAEERIEFSVSEATIAGAYGVLVTDRAVRSRDLMEPPVATPRADIVGVEYVDKDGLLLAPGQRHTLPSTLPKARRDALLTLLREHLTTTM